MEISTIKAIRDNSTLSDYGMAMKIFNILRVLENEMPFAITALYCVGIAEGKRMERARRRRAVI